MANHSKRSGAGTAAGRRRIIVVVVPPVEELDLVGPMQVFGAANRLSGRKVYSLEVATNGGELEVRGEGGLLSFLAQGRLKDVKGPLDSVLLVCGVGTRTARDPALSEWLRKVCPSLRRLGGVCVSSFLLAEAGVLNGKRATTHWKFGRELARRYPQVKVETEPIWVKDGNIYTSAGISAGIDLALAWVQEDRGGALAHEIARELVLFLRRPGAQQQLSVSLAKQASEMNTEGIGEPSGQVRAAVRGMFDIYPARLYSCPSLFRLLELYSTWRGRARTCPAPGGSRCLMLRLFVTGGAGFIGAAFVRLALEELPSCRITNFDLLTYAGNADNLNGLDESRHRFVRGDICDREAVLAALEEGTDAVVNFAAETHVDRSIISAEEFVRTNISGTQILLDAARQRGVSRFVQISTDEVMGSLADERSFFTEASPFEPNSPYAATKAAAEHLVRAAHHTHGLDATITRCGNNYGPRQFPEKFLPLMLANAMHDEPIPVYGDGRNVRDWIFVEDHCRAILAVMQRGRSGEAYNIGARNERHNLEVAESVLDALGKPRSLIKFVKDRPGHDRRYAIDPSKIERELDWHPRETWETGLAKTIRWYAENAEWVRRARSGEYREYYARQYGAELSAS